MRQHIDHKQTHTVYKQAILIKMLMFSPVIFFYLDIIKIH